MRTNPGKTVTIYDIPSIVNEAHTTAFSPRNILSAFSSTGIYPINRNLFIDIDFAPAATTDREQEVDQSIETTSSQDLDQGIEISGSRPVTGNVSLSTLSDDNVSALQSTSGAFTSADDSNNAYVSPSTILPLPKAGARKKSRTNRKKCSTRIVTDTPIRNEIAESAAKRKAKKDPPGNS